MRNSSEPSFSLTEILRQKIRECLDFAERSHGKWVTQWEIEFLDRMLVSSDFSPAVMKTINELHSRLMSINLI